MGKIAVIRFPGTNNEWETKRALESFNQVTDILEHYEFDKVPNYDGIWIAGGFSYGDVLRAGAIASASPMVKSIKDSGVPIIGVCNGFQILTESGLLPGALIPNSTTRFVCKWVNLKINSYDSMLESLANEILHIPIAHFEGNLWNDNEGKLSEMAAMYYSNETGIVDPKHNPNGSMHNIAGLGTKDHKILGMMPHPERASFKYQGSTDGRKIIEAFLSEVKN
jgi:phosphoribosylformylglycinamidine synthase subunit PurQ / glutaminase